VEEYRLGICDRDREYMLSFMDYMNMDENNPFRVSAFTDICEMGCAVSEGRVDMVLVSDSFDIREVDVPVIKLTEQTENADCDNYIFKYRSMREITSRLKSIARKNVRTSLAETGGFYAVYSPLGRSGVSTYALKLAGENEDSLLVKLENFRSGEGDDDAFMYYLLSHNESIGNIIRNIPVTDETGVRTVKGPLSYQDIRELKKADVEWLKDFLNRENICKMAVFDIGSGSLGSFDVLLAFDAVYIPCIYRDVDKLNTFKKLIGFGSGGGFENILKFIEMEE
jgi:hypothetical protein